MAEIHVQTKKHQSNPAWLWIIIGILIAAVVIYFVTRNKSTNSNTNQTQTNATSFAEMNQGAGHVFYLNAA